MAIIHLVVDELPIPTQRNIKKWARKKGYKVLRYRGGYLELQISKGYSRAMVVLYILTFWIGAIIHRLLRLEQGKMYIYLYPYGPSTFLTLRFKGGECAKAVNIMKNEIKAKSYRPSQFYH
jgi:hypothetical protein